MDYQTRQELEKDMMFGEHAASAQLVLDSICNHQIEEIKEDFLKMPIFDYQDIDKRAILVLQLKAEVVKDFQNKVKSLIAKGLEARKKLNGD